MKSLYRTQKLPQILLQMLNLIKLHTQTIENEVIKVVQNYFLNIVFLVASYSIHTNRLSLRHCLVGAVPYALPTGRGN